MVVSREVAVVRTAPVNSVLTGRKVRHLVYQLRRGKDEQATGKSAHGLPA